MERLGALVLGGDYRALGLVRGLGRRGVPVWVIRSRHDHALAATSRYCRRSLVWPWQAADDETRLAFLTALARTEGLEGWVLFPTADASAAFVARGYDALRPTFKLTTPPWDAYHWAYDKRATADLGARLGLDQPLTRQVEGRRDVAAYDGPFPVVLKPATKPRLPAPAVKAWRADNPGELAVRYEQALAATGSGGLVLQELVPGADGTQFSFAAACEGGEPRTWITAERVRQYPRDFGRYSTYVRAVRDDAVEDAGRRVLAALSLDGLAEVEFKRDPRDGRYRLLDINVRAWGWHTIAQGKPADFGWAAWRIALGRRVEPAAAPPGLAWMRLTTDVPAAFGALATRQLRPRGYVRSLMAPHERPVLAADDLLPGLMELPLFALGRATHHG